MSAIASTSHGTPYTCTASIAVVDSVTASSIRLGSKLKVIGSMSVNIGLIPFQARAWGVAAKVNGVVITSPEIPSARTAVSRAMVPLQKSEMSLMPRCATRRFEPSWTAPPFVRMPDCQMRSRYGVSFSREGAWGALRGEGFSFLLRFSHWQSGFHINLRVP